MAVKSNGPRSRRKPAPPPKPYAAFPLGYHRNGKFCKKVKDIDGEWVFVYFGCWAKREDKQLVPVADGGWEQALAEYEDWQRKQEQLARTAAALKAKDEQQQYQAKEQRIVALEAEASGELRLRELCRLYRNYGESRVKQKELKPKSFLEYLEMIELVFSVLGKDKIVSELTTNDFAKIRQEMAVAREWSPARIGKFIGLVSTMFNVAYDNEWIENKPRYGAGFKRPSKERCDEYANEGGDKLFTRDEVLKLLNGGLVSDKKKSRVWVGPTTQMKAMILLGCNCAFGNTDISVVPIEAFDFKSKLVRLPRTKTAVKRENPLWPETIEAVKAVLAERPDSKLPNLFLTRFGGPWVHEKTDAISRQFGALMKMHKIAPNVRRAGFYCLRHCFASVAAELGDRDAVKAIVGHKDKEMLARYIHGIVPLKQRLAASNHVRQWLFGTATAKKSTAKPTKKKLK